MGMISEFKAFAMRGNVLDMAVGIVTNTEIEDATPAAMVAHTRRRSEYDRIGVRQCGAGRSRTTCGDSVTRRS